MITKFDEANLPILRNELQRLWDAVNGISSGVRETVAEEIKKSYVSTSMIAGVVSGEVADPITSLIATGTLTYVVLSWTNPTTPSGDYIEIWRSETNDLTAASKVATVSIYTDVYWDLVGVVEVTRYYWIRVISKGVARSWLPNNYTGGVSGTTGTGTEPTEIEDFAVTASKLFIKIPVLEADSWTNNSPSAGYVAWNAHNLFYNGAKYEIVAGNTNFKYIYWLNGETSYTTSDTNPTLGDGDFIIAVNIDGSHDLAWNAIANQVIGSAYIQNAAIISAKIANLAVETANIANLAVNAAKIADLAVETAKINDLAVTSGKIGNLAVENAKIASGAITEAKIADLAVTAAKIANATITSAKIGDAQITSAKIGDLQVGSAKIGDLAVGTIKVAADAVDYSKRQVAYNGSADLSTFTEGDVKWWKRTIAHNLGRRVLVQLAMSGSLINTSNDCTYGLANNQLNSFQIQVSKNWVSGTGICQWDYW